MGCMCRTIDRIIRRQLLFKSISMPRSANLETLHPISNILIFVEGGSGGRTPELDMS